jgi:hypothetical protein
MRSPAMALKTPDSTGTEPDAAPISSFNLCQSHEIEPLATENQPLQTIRSGGLLFPGRRISESE